MVKVSPGTQRAWIMLDSQGVKAKLLVWSRDQAQEFGGSRS